MGLGGSSLRLSGAAELHRTQPQGASFPCFFFPFSSFFPLFFFFFPSFSPFFPSFLPSSLFSFSPWGWVRRCLAASLSLLSFAFCFLLLLSLLSAFAFSLAFVFCFSLRFLYILSSFHFFLHFFCPWLGAYIGSHGV